MHNLGPAYDQGQWGACQDCAVGYIARKKYGINCRTWLNVMSQEINIPGLDLIQKVAMVAVLYGLVSEEFLPYTKENLRTDWNKIPKERQDYLKSKAIKAKLDCRPVTIGTLDAELEKNPIVIGMPIDKKFHDYRGGLLHWKLDLPHSRHITVLLGKTDPPTGADFYTGQNEWAGWGYDDSKYDLVPAFLRRYRAEIKMYSIT